MHDLCQHSRSKYYLFLSCSYLSAYFSYALQKGPGWRKFLKEEIIGAIPASRLFPFASSETKACEKTEQS